MPKLLRTKVIQHSYTVGLCKNRHAEVQFRTKGSVLIHCMHWFNAHETETLHFSQQIYSHCKTLRQLCLA